MQPIHLFVFLESSHEIILHLIPKSSQLTPLHESLAILNFSVPNVILNLHKHNRFLHYILVGAIAFQAYYGDRDIIPVSIGEGSVVTFSNVPLNHGKG